MAAFAELSPSALAAPVAEEALGDGRATPEWLRSAAAMLRPTAQPPSPPRPPPQHASRPQLSGCKLLDSAEVDAEALPLDTVRGAVRQLMLSAGAVVDGTSDEAFELLVALELILGHGFRRRGLNEGFLHPPTLWSFIQLLEKVHEPSRKTIAFIRSSSLDDEARCSMWLRLCLNEGCLHPMLRTLYDECPAQQLRLWYKESAFVRSDQWLTVLLSLCAGLGDVNFQLPLSDEPALAPRSSAPSDGGEVAAGDVGAPGAGGAPAGGVLAVVTTDARGPERAAVSGEGEGRRLSPTRPPLGGAAAAAPLGAATAASGAAAGAAHVVPASALSSASALFANPPAAPVRAPPAASKPQPAAQPAESGGASAAACPGEAAATTSAWPNGSDGTAAAAAPSARARSGAAAAAAAAAAHAAPGLAAPPSPSAAVAAAAMSAAAPSAAAYGERGCGCGATAAPARAALASAATTHACAAAAAAAAGPSSEAEARAAHVQAGPPPSHAEAAHAACSALAASAAWPLHVPLHMRLLGAEQIHAREHYTAYKLQMVDARGDALGEPLYRRFSQFVQLVQRLCALRPLRTAPSLDPAAGKALQEWRRRLLAEKRRVGGLALKPDVVSGRCALLQQLMDVVCRPPLAALPEVRAFCGLAPAAHSAPPNRPASGRTSCADQGRAAPRYSATCPSCGRALRVTAPADAGPALFRCPSPRCDTVFQVALGPETE